MSNYLIRLGTVRLFGNRRFVVFPRLSAGGLAGVMVEFTNLAPGGGEMDLRHRAKLTAFGSMSNPLQPRFVGDPQKRVRNKQPVIFSIQNLSILGPGALVQPSLLPTWGQTEFADAEDNEDNENAVIRTYRNVAVLQAGIIVSGEDGKKSWVAYGPPEARFIKGRRGRRDQVSQLDFHLTDKNCSEVLDEPYKGSGDNLTSTVKIGDVNHRQVMLIGQPYQVKVANPELKLGQADSAAPQAAVKVALFAGMPPLSNADGAFVTQEGAFTQIDLLQPGMSPAQFFGNTKPCVKRLADDAQGRMVYQLEGEGDRGRYVWTDSSLTPCVKDGKACDVVSIPVVNGVPDFVNAEFSSTRTSNKKDERGEEKGRDTKLDLLTIDAATKLMEEAKTQAAAAHTKAETVPGAKKFAGAADKALTAAQKAFDTLKTQLGELAAVQAEQQSASDAGSVALATTKVGTAMGKAVRTQATFTSKVEAVKEAFDGAEALTAEPANA